MVAASSYVSGRSHDFKIIATATIRSLAPNNNSAAIITIYDENLKISNDDINNLQHSTKEAKWLFPHVKEAIPKVTEDDVFDKSLAFDVLAEINNFFGDLTTVKVPQNEEQTTT